MCKIVDVDEKDKTDDHENMISNSTFINPSQFEQSSSGILFKYKFVTLYQQERL